jgi:Flp pilus assembly protein TadG
LRPSIGRRSTSRGQALVEFVFAAPLLFMLLFGVIEAGRLIWTNHEVTNGTREGARRALVGGANATTQATEASIRDAILSRTAGLDGSRLSLDPPPTNLGGVPGTTVVVTTRYQYQPIVGMIFGTGTITLTARSEVIIQH